MRSYPSELPFTTTTHAYLPITLPLLSSLQLLSCWVFYTYGDTPAKGTDFSTTSFLMCMHAHTHTLWPASATKHLFPLSRPPKNVRWGITGGEGRGKVDAGERRELSERCTHQTWGGFHFCVKSRYQTGAGYASWEKKAAGGGAERQEGEKCLRQL